MHEGGMRWDGVDTQAALRAQLSITSSQASLEECFHRLARERARISNRPAVVLSDRGLQDGRAYLPEESALERHRLQAEERGQSWEDVLNSWLGPPPHGHGSTAASIAESSAGLGPGSRSIPTRGSATSLASIASTTSLASQAGGAASHNPLQTSLWNAILERCAGAAIDRAAISAPTGVTSAEDPDAPSAGHAQPASLLSEREVRDARYDCVVHLVTAADGAAEFYSTANNAARHEDADEARAVDRRIRQVWLGSPNFVVVHNPRGSSRQRSAMQAEDLTADPSDD